MGLFRRGSMASISSKSRRKSYDEGSVPVDINNRAMFKEHKPLLIITASSKTFDPILISHWEEEGFKVRFVPLFGDTKSATFPIQALGDELEAGEKYAVIAYGHAASVMLLAAFDVLPKLSTLVAFYPDEIPDPATSIPNKLYIQVHLAEGQPFAPRYPSFYYPDTRPGFNQRDSGHYNELASSIAWGRVLDVVRRGHGIDVDLESVWENHMRQELIVKDVGATMRTMVPEPVVNHVPTLTGGVGHEEMERWYREYFLPGNPPSLKMKLLSRTVGADKIVDEILVSFTHTCEIPWILPGVPPTGKHVEIAMVAVVGIRGGKLVRESSYWDQASVLVQIGVLDPRLGAVGLGEGGLSRLPVVGRESARKVADPEGVRSNGLIADW